MDSLRRGGSIAVINRNANRLAANDEFPGSRDLLVDVGNWMMDYGIAGYCMVHVDGVLCILNLAGRLVELCTGYGVKSHSQKSQGIGLKKK